MQECVGHFGHIELAVPVFHVGKRLVLADPRYTLADTTTRLYKQDQEDTRDCVSQLWEAFIRRSRSSSKLLASFLRGYFADISRTTLHSPMRSDFEIRRGGLTGFGEFARPN